MFKICSIGCGSLAFEAHGPSFRKYAALHPDAVLAACCDIDGQKAAGFRERFGFKRYYTDMPEMLDKERPDAVCLIVPVKLTAGLSVKVMEKGYPLLKPGSDKSALQKAMEGHILQYGLLRGKFSR